MFSATCFAIKHLSAFLRTPLAHCTFCPRSLGRVYRTRCRSRRRHRRRRRRRRRFGIPAFPYETNGMHKYFRRYSMERAEGGFSAATSACARRASVPNYRVGFMNTIAATARKLAWRHWLLLPLMNLCICIPRRCSARGTPQEKKKKSRRLLSARFLTLCEASRLATPKDVAPRPTWVRLAGMARRSPRCLQIDREGNVRIPGETIVSL